MMKHKYKIFSKNHNTRKGRSITKILFYLILSVLILLGIIYFGYKGYQSYKLFTEKVDINAPEFNQKEEQNTDQTELVIPPAKVLNVPYTVQAPLTNWNIHEESCEEAALLMYHYFLENQLTFAGKSVITPTLANEEEVKMKDWEVKNYGSEPDLTIEKWGKFAKDYYGYNFQTFQNISADDIKKEIAKGHPILVPVITHALSNPHYGRLPSYHVLLIKGYKSDGVIANDSGVKEGENYFYSWDILFKAIDAQTTKMNQGRVMAVLTK